MAVWRVVGGDVRERLREVAEGSVQTCVTSPPYWGLRDYGCAGQIGLEPTPDAYVAIMVSVFAEVWRVLRDDGTLWLNLGDSYVSNGRYESDASTYVGDLSKYDHRDPRPAARAMGLKPKDLVGIPWRVAFALQAAGWYLRSDIIWSKPNPMPESVTDRPTKAHEYLFLLSKRERYYYDSEAIAETASTIPMARDKHAEGYQADYVNRDRFSQGARVYGASGTRNKRSVWTVATQPYPEAHFATFPEALIEPCILAGSAIGDTVLDPFCGSGTTGVVAIRHQRHFVGIELNADYVELARQRMGGEAPLFSTEARCPTPRVSVPDVSTTQPNMFSESSVA
jgi:DNA modification methylase